MNKTKLIGERAYLSEIFLELEGISDLAENYYNIYGTRFKENQMKDWVKDVMYLGLIAVGMILLVIIGSLIV